MRYGILLTCTVLFASCVALVGRSEYYKGQVVVKFKEDSPALMQWLAQERRGQIKLLEKWTGNHESRGFVSNSTLQAIQKAINSSNHFAIVAQSPEVESLQRICLLTFENEIDAQVLATKISRLAEIEYAEPLFIRRVLYAVDDPDVGQQYHIDRLQVLEAWDHLPKDATIVVGIIDTGVDYRHEDLKDTQWFNQGESGNDSQGKDKRTNGVDDDLNGFVDDFQGWDFGTSKPGGDNDPLFGSSHGTHVAGIVAARSNNKKGGIGVCLGAKYIAVKVGPDGSTASSIVNGYDGIAYAAAVGAQVVNCSWGGSSFSNAEQEVINTVVKKLDCAVVAAAGNNSSDEAFFPAAYTGVLSVASTSGADFKSGFSNYNSSVDLTAPGSAIYSTVPGDNYTNMNGTSMSSPVAAGVVALTRMKYPNLTAIEVQEWVKATTDNIDANTEFYQGKLGRGRANALLALTKTNVKSALLDGFRFSDGSGDGVLDQGERVQIYLQISNVLSDLSQVRVEIGIPSMVNITLDSAFQVIGELKKGSAVETPNAFVFRIPATVLDNTVASIPVKVFDGTELIYNGFIDLVFKPTYRTFNKNKIAVTVNSLGSLGYNDYPTNSQGDGFILNGKKHLLFEGALLVGTGSDRLSNVARGADQQNSDKQFASKSLLKLRSNVASTAMVGDATYADMGSAGDANVSVQQAVFQSSEEKASDFILCRYDVVNNGPSTDSMFVGYYFDWDIGDDPQNNIVEYDKDSGYGKCYVPGQEDFGCAGVQLLTKQPINFFALDNDGGTTGTIGVYDGYTRGEKWTTISSGLSRLVSRVTDASMIIAAGPMKVASGDTAHVAFSIGAALSLEKLKDVMARAKGEAEANGIEIGESTSIPKEFAISQIFPNPTSGSASFSLSLANRSYVRIDLVDQLGRTIQTVADEVKSVGFYSVKLDLNDLVTGQYFVQVTAGRGTTLLPIVHFNK